MKRYVAKQDKCTNSESEFINDKWKTRYFYLYCDICGVKHPSVCVNEFDSKEKFGECEICWDCQKDLYYLKNRKCKSCEKTLKNLKKLVKLYYMDKTYYFCNNKCYYKYVKLKHPTSKKEWDKKFARLSNRGKQTFYSDLRKLRKQVRGFKKEYGENYHLKGIRHAYIWQRPRAD